MTPMPKCRGVSSHASVNRGTQSRVRRDDRASAGEALRNQEGGWRCPLRSGWRCRRGRQRCVSDASVRVLTHPLTSLLSKTVSARKERVRYVRIRINSRVHQRGRAGCHALEFGCVHPGPLRGGSQRWRDHLVAKVLDGMCRNLTDVEMVAEAAAAGESVNLDRIA
jgi:hypothetical protein